MRVLYQCEICGLTYKHLEEAERCEARGRPPEYPVGMLFSQRGYPDIVFAVAENYPEGHVNFVAAWAARDNGYGDNYNATCGISGALFPPDCSLLAFERIVANLEKRNIPITVWDGEKPVALGEFLARKEG
ncbi:MAG: hypothetical protein AB1330_01510 [Bacillota bacterium]